ncbi:MAG: putative glycolipid-binding domain-containing protein [Acidobacteriota bacterium]
MENERSMIWKRLDVAGHEAVRLYGDEDGWYLDGAAIFLHNKEVCRIEYLIECDLNWRSVFVSLDGWIGDDLIDLEISVSSRQIWTLNGDNIDGVSGCLDIDLNFSPITNTLPIRRLGLIAGESKAVRAAWLRFPSFELEPLDQTYTRVNATTVRYESGGGKFLADLVVDELGLVTTYPDYWTIED